jgi:hypothetical protein
MAWATVPVVALQNILEVNFDEVRAAIIERRDAAGLGWVVTDVTTDGCQARAVLNNYRAWVEVLIPLFANPAAAFVPYTKATCLTAAIGAVDWVANPDPPAARRMYVREINELRSVLNLLLWLRIDPTIAGSASYWSWPGGGSSNISWAAAWASALGAYAGAAPGPCSIAGFSTSAFSPSPPDGKVFYKDINRAELSDIAFVIPNVPVADTKLRVYEYGLGDVGQVDLYEQAAYAGGAQAVALPAAGAFYVNLDVTDAPPGATYHFSMRSNPVLPNPLTYPPADANGASRGWRCQPMELLVQFNFAYL